MNTVTSAHGYSSHTNLNKILTVHGESAGCPMASATSSATLWLCSAGHPVHELWAMLCPSELGTIVDVEPNLLTCISIVTTRCQRQDGDEVQNSRLPHVFCLRRPPCDFRLPVVSRHHGKMRLTDFAHR